MYYERILIVLVTCYVFSGICEEISIPHLNSAIKIFGYKGKLTKEVLHFFRHTEGLTFINCNLTEISGNLYSNFPNLKFLHVENNTFQDINRENVTEGADVIEELHFINNHWDASDIVAFGKMPKLKKLYVNDCKPPLKDIHANLLKKAQLEILELKNIGIENIDHLAFQYLDKLEVLSLSNNKIVSIPKEVFVHLKGLKVLDLSNNLIEKFDDTSLPKMENLEELVLTGNPLKNFNKSAIEKLAPKLKNVKT